MIFNSKETIMSEGKKITRMDVVHPFHLTKLISTTCALKIEPGLQNVNHHLTGSYKHFLKSSTLNTKTSTVR